MYKHKRNSNVHSLTRAWVSGQNVRISAREGMETQAAEVDRGRRN